MKPLVSYYGGKQRLASRIVQMIPEHSIYCEPFCGGATVFFAKPSPTVTNSEHYREVLNDTDGRLVNLYRVAKTQPAELLAMVEATPYAKSEYTRAGEITKSPDGYSDLQRAWAHFVNLNMSFSSKLNGGWGFSRVGQNRAATWANRKTTLGEAFRRLDKVFLDCVDAIKCIDRWDSRNTFFYIDPPYPGTNQGHYSGYTINNYQQLLERLENVKGTFILSNYAQDVTLSDAWRVVEVEAIMSVCKNPVGARRRTELLITNVPERQMRLAI